LTPSEAGQTLLDDLMLNVVLVLMFATSILGPVLTEGFALRLAAMLRTDLTGLRCRFARTAAPSKRSSEIKGGLID
jgi:hypothetical protein